jgi:acetoacetate decarboxylase
MMSTFEVQRRAVHLPVRARDADSWSAQFLVPVASVRALLAPASLDVVRVAFRWALVSLGFACYRDTDPGAYEELALAFLVAHRSSRRRETGLYVHWLPTSQPLAVEAGRTIWGYPRVLAAIDIAADGERAACAITQDGAHVLTLEVREGGRLRLRDPEPPELHVR